MVVGFGLVNLDSVAVVPAWERDQKVRASAYFEQVGGPVPVALQALARLEERLDSWFLGVVGDDLTGDGLEAMLRISGVEPWLQLAPGVATSRSLVFLDERDGSRTLANYAETLPPRAFSAADDALLGRAELLHVDGRDLDGCLHAAAIVRASGGTVSFDLGTMRPGREALIAVSDIVLASQGGGAGAFPDVAVDPIAQVERFLAIGARIAGVTLAERGVVIGARDLAPTFLPAFRTGRVLDTCGAGDTFHGAFLHAWRHGADPVAAADFAQAAVALRITRYGNVAGLPTRTDVEAFLQTAVRVPGTV